MDSWSKLIFRRNVSKVCLKVVENIKIYQEKKEGKQLYFEFSRQGFGQFFIQDFAGVSWHLEAASLILALS